MTAAEFDRLIETLHPLERQVLSKLHNYSTLQDIAKHTNLEEIKVMRAFQWLQNKKIITIKE